MAAPVDHAASLAVRLASPVATEYGKPLVIDTTASLVSSPSGDSNEHRRIARPFVNGDAGKRGGVLPESIDWPYTRPSGIAAASFSLPASSYAAGLLCK
jgi:hypothetical protein